MDAEADRILRARAGDRRALEDLIRAYQELVARFVASRVADRAALPDLCQSVFVKMVLSISRLRSPEAFEPWLFRVAENACRDHLRRERWRRLLFVPAGAAQTEAVSAQSVSPPDEDSANAIAVGLERLEVRQRELLALSIEKPRSYEELAALTDLSVSALKSRLFRARASLRRLATKGGKT